MKAIDLAVVKALVNQAVAKLSEVKPPEVDYDLVKSFIPPARDALPAKEVDYDLIKSFIPAALPALPATKVDYDFIKSFIPPALPANEVDYDLVKSFIPPALPAKEVDYDLIKSFIPAALNPKEVDYDLVKSFIPVAKVGQAGRGIASIKVNEEDMLVVTYDDGDMTIAGKVSITRESTGGGNSYTGAPVGSFGITGTKTNDAGELIIVGAWGKEFNTGFTSVQQRAEETNDWITLTTSFSSIPTFNTPLFGGSVYNYLYNDDTLTLYRYIDVAGGDRYFADFDGLVLENLVATKKAQTITL